MNGTTMLIFTNSNIVFLLLFYTLTFLIVLKDSNMFAKAENDQLAQDYFNLLDKDNNGVISFSDFLSLFLKELSP